MSECLNCGLHPSMHCCELSEADDELAELRAAYKELEKVVEVLAKELQWLDVEIFENSRDADKWIKWATNKAKELEG